MDPAPESIEERITRLHGQGMVDLHFDLPMFLYDNRDRKNVLASDFLPEFERAISGRQRPAFTSKINIYRTKRWR
jgi:hypothetical protein